MKNDIPSVYDQLVNVCEKLEHHFRDMQDFEFTIENNKLYILQTMNNKHTGLSVVKISVEMVNERLNKAYARGFHFFSSGAGAVSGNIFFFGEI